ncbi:MAG TPA: S9 family peptidase [Rhizomicrobium sp.]
MKPNLIAFCVCLIALVPAPAAVGAPLEAYGRLPALENLSLSPDGKELAYVTGYQGDSAVVVYDIDSAKVTAGINVGHVTVRNVRWADNDNILVTASSVSLQDVLGPKTARFVAQIFTVSTKSLHPLMIGTSDSLNVIYGVPVIRVINGRTIAFVHGEHFVEGRGQLTFFAIDIGDSDFAANRVRLIQQGNPLSEGWIVDQNGNVVAAVEYNESNKDWVLNLEIRNRWVKAVDVVTPIDIPTIEGFSADGRSLIVRMLDKGSIAIKQVSLADGSVTEMANAEPYLAYPIVDERTGRVVGHVRTDSTVHYAFLDGSDQARWNSVVQAFPGETVELVSASSDKKRVIVRVDGPRSGCEYEFVDLNTGAAKTIGPKFEGIGAADVSDVKYISYAAADGRSIPAYLTLPRGRAPKNLPLVVLAHGGPTAQDEPGFDWWAQALASRGYAVLQPQFRGSTGFGWEHLSAGFGQWGRKMQTDLSDGVRHLASQGIVDPKRVCIVGASYGGYAALAGPTLDRGVYRCAVAVAPVSDPHEMLRWQRNRQITSDSVALRFWSRFMGVESYDDSKLSDISPVAHAAQADAPILLIHGTNDTVVPISQSEDMDSALHKAGKSVSFVRLDSEDHWLSRSETREQMLQATVAFLETHNPAN